MHYKLGTCMAIQTKTWMTSFLFKFFCLFQEVGPRWYLSKQLSSINSTWTWFTCQLKSNRTCTTFWSKYDYLTFTHFPCLVTFKPFKTSFKKKKTNNMVIINYNELNKAILVAWVNKALDVALSKRNIKSGFQVT